MSFKKVKDFVSNNKKKVIAGTVLVVGGTVLYYLAKQRGTVVTDWVEKYTTLEDAIAALAVYVENEKDAAVFYEKGLFTVMDL